MPNQRTSMSRAAKILWILVLCGLTLGATAGEGVRSGCGITLLASSERPRGAIQQPMGSRHFRLDASQSKFIAHALRGGLLWFKGHEHLVAAREFTGEAQLSPDKINPAALQLTVKTDSMVETSDAFTEPQKQIINKELREIVLETAKYPEIVFKSSDVSGKPLGNNQYDLRIGGDLTLHGVTRHIVIPAKVILAGNDLRAIGEFSIDRSDFKVKATSAFHGLVRVREKVKFTFDIVGHEDSRTRIET